MASLTQTRELGFEPTPLHRIAGDFSSQRNWKQRASGCGNVDGANVDKMLEVDPKPALRHSKEAAA